MEMSDQHHVPPALTMGKSRLLRIYSLGGWVGPRADTDHKEKRRVFAPTGNRIPIPALFSP
jgi:hypothetical protein